MCGIIGYAGRQPAAPILLEGLSRLEYRGYDSSGIAVFGSDGGLNVHKSAGKLSELRRVLNNGLPEGSTGLGHTRWATHGAPTSPNAHPHTDCNDEVVVVHNGIVENYLELRRELADLGHEFTSQTDSECIPHLIESYLADGSSLEDAVRRAGRRVRGAHAVVAACKREPGKLVGLRLGNAGGIVVGYGQEDMYLASDLPALLPYTQTVSYLASEELVTISGDGASFTNANGAPVKKSTARVPYDHLSAVRGEYKHFMLKEINEQPEAIINTLRGRVSFETSSVVLDEVPFSDQEIQDIEKVVLVGMGTSLHAAMVGRMWMESLARIPSESDNSSEFRYRDPVIGPRTLVVSVCQSGETADTLAAMEEASKRGARQITLCNYEGTQTTRIADSTVLIRAGLEIGVASTKTFACSLTALYLLALYLGAKRKAIPEDLKRELIQGLAELPQTIGKLLADQAVYPGLAEQMAKYPNFLFLGRGMNYPLAMEGALKLKEVSYIHAEGYPAGEMKHGPISLIDEEMPVVALIPRDNLYEKMLSNVNEVSARGGRIVAVATEGDTDLVDRTEEVLYVPESSPPLTPILMAIPMQLLAYHIGVRRGCDVDQPRNLAKSVTVE